MKKITLILCLIVTVSFSSQAQRLLKGQKGIWISAGVPISKHTKPDTDNFSLSAGLTYTTQNANYWCFGVNYMRKGYKYRKQIVPVENLLLESGYMLNILADGGRNVLLNVGLSGVVGYEVINESEAFLDDGATLLDKDSFVYGVGGQIAIEGFVTDNLMLFAKAKTAIFWGSDMGKFRPQTSVGIRVLF